MLLHVLKLPHNLFESLVYRQIRSSSEVNPKLQICWVISRAICLGLGWTMSVLAQHVIVFVGTKSRWKKVGRVPKLWQTETEMKYVLVGYCPTCKDMHSLQIHAHMRTEGTSVKRIAVLVDWALYIFKSCLSIRNSVCEVVELGVQEFPLIKTSGLISN